MAQIDNIFTAFWMDTSTAPGTPLTGLSATILIKLAESPYTVVVNNEDMTDIGNGDYIYTFAGYDSNKNYIYHCNPGATAYIESGVTDKRMDHLDKAVSEIAVGWNPYITGIGGIQNGIQKIVDKVEDKGNEVKKKIESEVKTIVIPEQKESIVNVTTEKIDTEGFMTAIKAIKPEVNVTTEKVSVDLSPVLTAIKNIPQPVIPEQKEVDLSPITDSINDVKEDILEKLNEEKGIYEAVGRLFETRVNGKEDEDDDEEERMKKEEQNLKKPFPKEFTARLN